MTDQKQTAEERFRDSLLDVVALLEKLRPICKTVDELTELCNLGLSNEGQMRLIMLAAGAKTK